MFKSLLCFNINSFNKRKAMYLLLYYTHIPFMYNKLVAELVMGRVCMGRVGYGPSLSWAEFVMGRDVQLPSNHVAKGLTQQRGC